MLEDWPELQHQLRVTMSLLDGMCDPDDNGQSDRVDPLSVGGLWYQHTTSRAQRPIPPRLSVKQGGEKTVSGIRSFPPTVSGTEVLCGHGVREDNAVIHHHVDPLSLIPRTCDFWMQKLWMARRCIWHALDIYSRRNGVFSWSRFVYYIIHNFSYRHKVTRYTFEAKICRTSLYNDHQLSTLRPWST